MTETDNCCAEKGNVHSKSRRSERNGSNKVDQREKNKTLDIDLNETRKKKVISELR
jgi:hypothetical protein